jgi:hypothetical protein
MVLQSTGPIKLSDIQTEFGGINPIVMNEYFSDISYALGVSGIPASGNPLNVGSFRGKARSVSSTSNNTYYSDLTRLNGSSFTIVQSGTNPDVQLQMNSASYTSQVTHVYGQHRLQDFSALEINFEIFISSSAAADALWFYMGQSVTPDTTQYEGITGTGYQLIFEVYNAPIPRGINLYKNGGTSAVNYSTTSHISSTWLPVKIVYKKSSTNTWSITFNGTNIINYSDPNHATWLANSGRFWGFGSRVGGETGNFYIRRLNVQIYSFSSHTFTNAGVTGSTGPTLSQCRSAYSSSTWAQDTTNNFLNMTTQGIQLWTVPATGSYTITCAGARGGTSTQGYSGGRGFAMQGTFYLIQGQILSILVGQSGSTNSVGNAGGGGGSFVITNSSPLIIGGGGGGATSFANGLDANTGTSGVTPISGGSGGTNGSGASGGTNGSGAGNNGGGYSTDGSGGGGYTNNEGTNLNGKSYANGGRGGYSTGPANAAFGGFGGGACGYLNGISFNTGGGGGGGGYSGGGGGPQASGQGGGGGGSYGGSFYNYNTDYGYVTIIKV